VRHSQRFCWILYRTFTFEDCLADTDILWTKPSELVFYAALGLPILLAPPVGGQERANREWLLRHGAGIDMGEAALLDENLQKWLAEGKLARIALDAYSRLDRDGLRRILDIVGKSPPLKCQQNALSLSTAACPNRYSAV
jgi:hypothetical protein